MSGSPKLNSSGIRETHSCCISSTRLHEVPVLFARVWHGSPLNSWGVENKVAQDLHVKYWCSNSWVLLLIVGPYSLSTPMEVT